jgi:hypothetical protein
MKPIERSFHVGDWVQLAMGPRKVSGKIVEDRGLLGVGGRRLFYVQVPQDPYEPKVLLMPEDELESENGSERRKPIPKHKIIEFLKNGGLFGILLATTGAPNQPRVWLCRDTLGNVTYTFDPERGLIGGAVIPFGVRDEDGVSSSKKEAVSTFVQSFGLSRPEADEAIQAMGNT